MLQNLIAKHMESRTRSQQIVAMLIRTIVYAPRECSIPTVYAHLQLVSVSNRSMERKTVLAILKTFIHRMSSICVIAISR